jgi:hypothetical protein
VQWWLEDNETETLSEQSDEYRHIDPWMERISDWLISNGTSVSTRGLLERALKLDANQMTRSAEMRIGEVMRDLGYERKRVRAGKKRVYEWYKRDSVVALPFNETSEW